MPRSVRPRHIVTLVISSLATALVALVAPPGAEGTATSSVAAADARFTELDGDSQVRLGNALFFLADDGVHGTELWTTDGTAAGSRLVVDTNPGGAGSDSDYDELVATPSGLLLVGSGVARLDPASSALTELAGPSSFGFDVVAHLGSRTLVRGGSSNELFVVDGGAGSLTSLGQFRAGDDAAVLGGVAYFEKFIGTGLGIRPALWRSDGTPGGTSQVTEVPGYGLSRFVATSNRVYFSAEKSSTRDFQTWVSDGTAPGTRKLTSFRPYEAAAVGSRLFFTQQVASGRWELRSTTGGPPSLLSTAPEQPGSPGLWDLTPVGGRLAFVRAYQLWITDATAGGTVRLHPGATVQAIDAAVSSLGQVVYSGNAYPGIGYTWQSGRFVGSEQTLGLFPAIAPPHWTLGSTLISTRVGSDGFYRLSFRRVTVRRPVIRNVRAARIVGPARAGRTLRLQLGTWTPSSVQLRRQWYVDGRLRRGATGPTLALRAGDRGARVHVVVTATAPGARRVVLRVAGGRVAR